jgi:hypothetical protein
MARENSERDNAEREMAARFDLMVAAMARQVEAFEVELADRGPAPRVWSETRTFTVMPVCHGTGHAGAV